jgi:hypothetical protein
VSAPPADIQANVKLAFNMMLTASQTGASINMLVVPKTAFDPACYAAYYSINSLN